MLEDLPDTQVAIDECPLSGQQLRVLQFIADGWATKEIAVRLQIKDRTVEWHIQGILVALGAVNRTEAVAIAVSRGYFRHGSSVELLAPLTGLRMPGLETS